MGSQQREIFSGDHLRPQGLKFRRFGKCLFLQRQGRKAHACQSVSLLTGHPRILRFVRSYLMSSRLDVLTARWQRPEPISLSVASARTTVCFRPSSTVPFFTLPHLLII